MMKSRSCLMLLTLGLAVLLTACGHHNNSAPTTANVRIVNATHVANLTLTSTNTASGSTAVTVASSVAAGGSSSYTAVDSGTTALVGSVGDGSLAASNSTTVGLTAGSYYTVIAFARNGIITLVTLLDGQTAPATGFALFSISNPAPDAGPLDVYVVSPGAAIDDTVTPKYQNVFSGGNSLAQSIAAGTYDIVITAYNKPADVRLKIAGINLKDQEIATLMLTSTTGGALVDGTLVQQDTTTSQGGAITAYNNTNARIRLVGAFSSLSQTNYTATAPDGTTNYSDSLISSSISAGQYKLVAAGTKVQNVYLKTSGSSSTVQPTNIVADASCQNTLYDATNHCSASKLAFNAPLVAGNEYTLLVYGDTTAMPVQSYVQLLSDNNQAPTAARVRVVNVVQLTSGDATFDVVDLFNSSVPLFQAVQYEQTSDYAGLTTGVSHLAAQVEALATPEQKIEDGKNIALGGVYTLIMGGTTDGTNDKFTSKLLLDRCLPTIQC
ncbi:MAG TPA: DUF4397 domain-containing protein [Steroidobacteraceae bacterium]|nr:DUF4397 domain-containing protein [Steroidobacteraceae bacterium]